MNLKAVAVSALAMSSVAMADIADVKPVVFESKFDFQTTVITLTNTLKEKGMTIFAEIDHQAAAKQAGLEMQPATVLVYGTPKAGTPLMVKDPMLALQLPLKVLITEPNKGKVEVMLNRADQVVAHANTDYADVENNLAKAEKLIKATVAK
ncbi:TPA: DUF302 domain-containing protein [Mannheimia haemolytica]|nr:DUF302 domain-containing protein [Mannheimia haemolytica]